MIVVADTSPLNYVIQVGREALLPRVFGKVVVPRMVGIELSHPHAPEKVRSWASTMPDWVDAVSYSLLPDPQLEYLGDGERETIQISQEIGADLILIDDLQGRNEANSRGFRITGTLGVLLDAGEMGSIDAKVEYRRLLAETNFRTSVKLESEFLRRVQ
jgi:predicted nucleic acid-binding protein